MKRDFCLMKKILLALENGAKLGLTMHFLDENEFSSFKKINDLDSYSRDELKKYVYLMSQYEILGNSADPCITSFGYRFLSFLQNDSLFKNLQTRLADSFDLYLPQTLVALAQQIDLQEKGFNFSKSSIPVLDTDGISDFEELVFLAKSIKSQLESSAGNGQRILQEMEVLKKDLDQKIKQAELIGSGSDVMAILY
jgi:hypothetical protein